MFVLNKTRFSQIINFYIVLYVFENRYYVFVTFAERIMVCMKTIFKCKLKIKPYGFRALRERKDEIRLRILRILRAFNNDACKF